MIRKPKKIPRPTHFGANLKHLRTLDGSTQKGLAEAVGITRNKVATYEYGVVEPNAATLLRICDYFGVSVASMLSSRLDKDYIKGEVEQPDPDIVRGVLYQQIEAYITHNARLTKVVEGYRTLQSLKQTHGTLSHESQISSTNDIVQVLSSLLSSNWEWIESLSLTDIHDKQA